MQGVEVVVIYGEKEVEEEEVGEAEDGSLRKEVTCHCQMEMAEVAEVAVMEMSRLSSPEEVSWRSQVVVAVTGRMMTEGAWNPEKMTEVVILNQNPAMANRCQAKAPLISRVFVI